MDIYTARQAMEYLQIKPTLLYELTGLRQIPYIQHRPNGKLYFLKSDLDDYLLRQREKSIPKPLAGGTLRKVRR